MHSFVYSSIWIRQRSPSIKQETHTQTLQNRFTMHLCNEAANHYALLPLKSNNFAIMIINR